MDIPVLETERLILREFRGDDFEPMAEFYADPISSFYGGPCGSEDTWRNFAMYPGHWSLRRYGPWALEEKSTGAFVGLSGLWFPEGWPEPEITWALLPRHHRTGYATEAAHRTLVAAYQDFEWPTAVSVIALPNTASARVAERLGATLDGTVENRYGTAAVYRHAPLVDLLSDT